MKEIISIYAKKSIDKELVNISNKIFSDDEKVNFFKLKIKKDNEKHSFDVVAITNEKYNIENNEIILTRFRDKNDAERFIEEIHNTINNKPSFISRIIKKIILCILSLSLLFFTLSGICLTYQYIDYITKDYKIKNIINDYKLSELKIVRTQTTAESIKQSDPKKITDIKDEKEINDFSKKENITHSSNVENKTELKNSINETQSQYEDFKNSMKPKAKSDNETEDNQEDNVFYNNFKNN